MAQINIIGPALGITGYDSHVRQLANALNKYTKVRLQTQLNPGIEKQINDQELEMIKRLPEKDEINLIITNPAGWLVNLNAKRNWVFLIWEGDIIPKWIIEQCLDKRIEYIFVASNHTLQAVLKTLHETPNIITDMTGLKGINSTLNDIIIPKIKVMPHGVDLEKFYPKDKPKKLTFILNKGFKNLEDRGGVQYFLKAYLEEFSKADNVEAIIKLNPAYGIPDLNKIIKEMTNKTEAELPKLAFDLNAYPYNELVKLYNSGNVFVSPTRAEAYNLGCIEAMACGLPVITTNFGGQTDFVNQENGWLIGGELTEIKHDILYEGTKWLTPNLKELKETLRFVYDNQGLIKIKGDKANETALDNTWYQTAKKIIELVK